MKTKQNIKSNSYFPCTKKSFGLLLALFCFIGANGQNFNYEYRNNNGYSITQPLGKSIVEMDAQCGVATVNSIYNDNGFLDFQITFLKPTGDFYASYSFGDLNGNDVCHGVCKSLEYNDQFLMCGRSSNNLMLVMKVDMAGNVIWSKEISFSFIDSEGITVFPVNNNPNDKGYIIVGNSNSTGGTNSVAAAKIDEAGNLIWSAEYNMGVKLQMTDAIARTSLNDRVVSITGYRQFGGIFYLNIYAYNGAIFYYPGATYDLVNPTSLYGPQLTEIEDSGLKETVITFGRNAFNANSVGIYAFRTEGYSDFSVSWAKYYAQPGQHGYINSDLITLSTGRVSLIGGVNTYTGGSPNTIIHPYILNINVNGSLGQARDFDVGEYEFSGSAIESCGSGYEAFNAFNLNYGTQWDIKVIKQDSPGMIECEDLLTWDSVDEDIEVAPINMTSLFVGTISDYDVVSLDHNDDRFNCFGNPMMAIHNEFESNLDYIDGAATAGIFTDENNQNWFYPNPANNNVQLQLTGGSHQISIYSVSGEILLSEQYSNSEMIDLSHFSSGVYFIEKKDNSGLLTREKLVIQ